MAVERLLDIEVPEHSDLDPAVMMSELNRISSHLVSMTTEQHAGGARRR